MAYRFATVADVNDADSGVWPACTLSTAQIQLWLDITQEWIGIAVFKAQTSQAHALRAVHAMLVASEDESGSVVSEAHGPASRSFAAPAIAAGDESLSTTWAGRAFLEIRKTVSPLPVRIRSGYP